jgi:hypothetical protein
MMNQQDQAIKGSWSQRFIKFALGFIILALIVDYGKHVILKHILTDQIHQSHGLVSIESMSVSWWPLFGNHIVMKNFHVNISGTPISSSSVKIRQGWAEWQIAHISALDIRSNDFVTIREGQGLLDTKDLNTRINVSDLVLKDIHATLPLVSFSGTQASFNFLYDMTTHHLSLKADAPEMMFENGATFGLNGEGVIHTNGPIQGEMDVKIKNIDKMLKELVSVGVINESQAGLVTKGTDFLGKIGLHDITLPLKIDNGDVFLGPVHLFKIEKKS